jgi:uncharacterized protein
VKKTANRVPVSVADLVRHPGRRREVHLEEHVDDLATSIAAVPADRPVRIDLVLEGVSDTIVATGTAQATWRSECRRCLRLLEGAVAVPLREIFEPDPEEGETYLLAGDHVDLAPMVREAVLLELPLAPLCREDCAGLCPRCGADRNDVPCGCDLTVRDPRWAALDGLQLPED